MRNFEVMSEIFNVNLIYISAINCSQTLTKFQFSSVFVYLRALWPIAEHVPIKIKNTEMVNRTSTILSNEVAQIKTQFPKTPK
jgi:hypothetical protein